MSRGVRTGACALALVLAWAPAGGGEAPSGAPPARRANRLASEKSPYLLQHAHNPVDWFPWGEEAFAKARAEKKPIFLSIGYSTCHWCHVMERESFENPEIARILNESFVAIKVDREERPDVDDVYMTAVQMLFGNGGWPLSVFLTPEGKPFFGGTYFPPEDDPGRGRGFRSLLLLVAKKWQEEREKIDSSANGIVEKLQAILAPEAKAPGGELSPALLEGAFAAFRDQYDGKNGGFGGSPKFPRTTVLDFLLFHSVRSGNSEARSMALRTLDHMARGGIRDHLAGGFHRYSTDAEWTVPHFEKMLYDQALIARTYFDAGRLSGEAKYLLLGREILDYVLTRLSRPEGGFWSAEDADSDGEEGKYYVWTRAEVVAALGEEDGRMLADFHGVTPEGNFEGSPRSVLTARRETDGAGGAAAAPGAALSPGAAGEARLRAAQEKLLRIREKRVPPRLDDKILTDWNGLMISALAVGYQATGEIRYLEAAERTAGFLRRTMVREDGRLLHRFRDGEAKIAGFLDDYSFLIAGLLDLYEAGFNEERIREAVRLAREMGRLFWDPKDGGFFPTAPDQEKLILRKKEFYDGAIPSGNSVAYLDLLRLVELTGDADFRAKAAVLEGLAASRLAESPREHPQLLVAAAFRLAKPRQIAVVGARDDAAAADMVRELHRRCLPAKVLARLAPGDAAAQSLLPFLEGKLALDGRATAYVCRDNTCKLPAKDLATLRKQLAED